jgi:hypothetical protein
VGGGGGFSLLTQQWDSQEIHYPDEYTPSFPTQFLLSFYSQFDSSNFYTEQNIIHTLHLCKFRGIKKELSGTLQCRKLTISQ